VTVAFVVKTAYYTSGGGGSWTQATRATALSFSIQHEFNRPAEAIVVLADNDGTLWQEYIGGGKAYLAAGILYIEQPAETTIFDGRIFSIKQDLDEATVTIRAKDWMDQLDDDRITYYMTEDLTGGGVYKSETKTDIDNATYVGPVYTNGANYYLWDDDMSWDDDEWNGLKLIFLGDSAGPVTVKTGPYDETVTFDGTAMTTDLPAAGERNVWSDDGTFHWLSDAKAANPNEADTFRVDYDFRVFATEGSLYSSGPTAMKVNLTYKIWGGGASEGFVYVYDHNGAAWVKIGDLQTAQGAGGFKRITLQVPEVYVARGFAIDTDGVCHIRIEVEVPANQSTSLYVDFIEVETDLVSSGVSTVIGITDVDDGGGVNDRNRLKVDTDLSITGLGIWEACPYAICKKISQHINTIVTGNDQVLTMTTSVEATSNYSTRKFEDFSPHRILQELGEADGAVFWVTLGGKQLTWKATFTDAAPTAITDASVLFWADGILTMEELFNRFNVYGVRYGDRQVYETATDSTSVTKYRTTRVKIFKGTGMLSDAEADDFADAQIARYNDPVYPALTCMIDGLSALRLGDEIRITSTYNNMTNLDYTIVRWAYDSDNDATVLGVMSSDYGLYNILNSPMRLRDTMGTVVRDREEKDSAGDPVGYKG
jgi:hypothetical protein